MSHEGRYVEVNLTCHMRADICRKTHLHKYIYLSCQMQMRADRFDTGASR